MKSRGVTLVELIIVISIIGILAVALGFSYVGWQGKYKVESEIKTLYAAMMTARTRAMTTNRYYFLDISPDGRFYRITQDDSNGVAKVFDGDGTIQAQSPWAAIQAQTSNPVNWGAVSATTDTTVTELSRRLELSNNPPSLGDFSKKENAGLLYGAFVYPNRTSPYNTFRLGFDKNGIIRNMLASYDGTTVSFPATTNIENAVPIPPWAYQNPTICIYTDYDGDKKSDYDPDYDCIVASDAGIRLGKIKIQNTDPALWWCREDNCVTK